MLLLRVDYTFTKRDTLLLRASALVYLNRPMDFFTRTKQLVPTARHNAAVVPEIAKTNRPPVLQRRCEERISG